MKSESMSLPQEPLGDNELSSENILEKSDAGGSSNPETINNAESSPEKSGEIDETQEAIKSSETAPTEQQETVEDINRELDPESDLKGITERLEQNESAVNSLREALQSHREEINKTRLELGLPPLGENEYSKQEKVLREQLDVKEKEHEQIEGDKDEAETVKDLNEVLSTLANQPKDVLLFIKQHGTMPDGKMLEGSKGKIDKSIAKQLGEYAEKGVKKLTAAMLNILVGIVKGILKGIFEVASAVAASAFSGEKKE